MVVVESQGRGTSVPGVLLLRLQQLLLLPGSSIPSWMQSRSSDRPRGQSVAPASAFGRIQTAGRHKLVAAAAATAAVAAVPIIAAPSLLSPLPQRTVAVGREG